MPLKVSAVALCRADVSVPELALDVHERVARGESRGGRGMPERVQGHVAKRGVLERVLVPVARDGGAIKRLAGASALPAAALPLGDAHGITNRCALP